jgi:hypothetical protein
MRGRPRGKRENADRDFAGPQCVIAVKEDVIPEREAGRRD